MEIIIKPEIPIFFNPAKEQCKILGCGIGFSCTEPFYCFKFGICGDFDFE